jgi:hypothetical protein
LKFKIRILTYFSFIWWKRELFFDKYYGLEPPSIPFWRVHSRDSMN